MFLCAEETNKGSSQVFTFKVTCHSDDFVYHNHIDTVFTLAKWATIWLKNCAWHPCIAWNKTHTRESVRKNKLTVDQLLTGRVLASSTPNFSHQCSCATLSCLVKHVIHIKTCLLKLLIKCIRSQKTPNFRRSPQLLFSVLIHRNFL